MLTADPRLVKGTRVVPHLSFAEASELAYFGAKVLHPATIQPAVADNIPVKILNARRPLDARGTLITRDRPATHQPLTAVASKKGVTVVDITSTRMLMAHGFLSHIFDVFEQFKTPVDVVTTSEVSVSVTIDDRRALPQIIEKLTDVADVTRKSMAIVCAVGGGCRTIRPFRRLLHSIGGVPIRMMSQAASRRNITFVIREEDLVKTSSEYDTFFGAVPRRQLVRLCVFTDRSRPHGSARRTAGALTLRDCGHRR